MVKTKEEYIKEIDEINPEKMQQIMEYVKKNSPLNRMFLMGWVIGVLCGLGIMFIYLLLQLLSR